MFMNKPTNYLIPTVIEKSADGERAFDIYSRLLNERIIFLGEEVNEHTANSVVAQLLHLAYVDPEADISLYINSPGGSVYDGMAIYDTMNFIKPDVRPVSSGQTSPSSTAVLNSVETVLRPMPVARASCWRVRPAPVRTWSATVMTSRPAEERGSNMGLLPGERPWRRARPHPIPMVGGAWSGG